MSLLPLEYRTSGSQRISFIGPFNCKPEMQFKKLLPSPLSSEERKHFGESTEIKTASLSSCLCVEKVGPGMKGARVRPQNQGGIGARWGKAGCRLPCWVGKELWIVCFFFFIYLWTEWDEMRKRWKGVMKGLRERGESVLFWTVLPPPNCILWNPL